MIAAFNTLRRDAWVLGIACAAALAYSVVSFLEAAVAFVLQLIDGPPVFEPGPEVGPTDRDLIDLLAGQPFSFVVGDHYVYYGPLLTSLLIMVVTVVVVAFVLHATRDSGTPE